MEAKNQRQGKIASTIYRPKFKKGEITMEDKIKWETSMNNALLRAKSENKNVLLDFFNPN